MFVAIGILDPQISHFSILKFKLNHEQRKDPLHLFWDIITSMMYNTIGRINQKSWKSNHIFSWTIISGQC